MNGNGNKRFFTGPDAGFELVVSGGSSMRFPPHTHVSTVTVILVRKGTVSLTADGVKHRLRPGDVFALPPHCKHSLAAAAPYEMISFCADAALATDRKAAATLRAAAGRGHLRKREATAIAKGLRSQPTPQPPADDALALLKDGLVANPEREMTLGDMAIAAHLGKYHLIRKFRKRYGLTPRGFQNQNRLRKARREFMSGGSLTQAALRAGFYDQSHFIRYFKRFQGMTPGQYLQARASL